MKGFRCTRKSFFIAQKQGSTYSKFKLYLIDYTDIQYNVNYIILPCSDLPTKSN